LGRLTVFCPVFCLVFGMIFGMVWALSFAAAAVAAERPPSLSLPLDCGGAIACTVQRYVDRQAGPEARDYRCGDLVGDAHKGTDFRLDDLRQMQKGVRVRAAAAGVVAGRRDDFPEHRIEDFDPARVKGRECGNGVVLDHGGGWTTQYCHLRRYSIPVVKGQRVNAGEALGLIGLSGETTFPHVHFSLRHQGRIVDPFSGVVVDDQAECGQTGLSLWTEAARKALPYRASGVIRAGFAGAVPTAGQIRAGDHAGATLPAGIAKLVFWVRIYGLQAGDIEEFVIDAPGGKRLLAHRGKPLAEGKIIWFSYVGKPLKSASWPRGGYRGSYRLWRMVKGKRTPVVQVERRLTLE